MQDKITKLHSKLESKYSELEYIFELYIIVCKNYFSEKYQCLINIPIYKLLGDTQVFPTF